MMVSIERRNFKEVAACVATLGALASLQACSGETTDRSTSLAVSSDRPDLDCTNAGLFTDYGTGGDVLNVNVINGDNDQVLVDSVRVRELETQRQNRYPLADNKTPITLSKKAIQVVIKVEKNGHVFACPTLYYPNRR